MPIQLLKHNLGTRNSLALKLLILRLARKSAPQGASYPSMRAAQRCGRALARGYRCDGTTRKKWNESNLSIAPGIETEERYL